MIRKINKLLIFAAALSGAACGEQAGMPTAANRAEAIVAEKKEPAPAAPAAGGMDMY